MTEPGPWRVYTCIFGLTPFGGQEKVDVINCLRENLTMPLGYEQKMFTRWDDLDLLPCDLEFLQEAQQRALAREALEEKP